MNTAEFEKATKKVLRRKANECFDKLKDSGSHEWPAILMEARFYLDEIERREHDWVSMRDLILELVVIVLIGLELYFGIAGGNAQLDLLQKLNLSASQTATAVTVLAEEQKVTLDAITELDGQIQDQNPKVHMEQKQLSHKEVHKHDH